MYQVTFSSLGTPSSREQGSTLLRRASVCIADKIRTATGGILVFFDYDPENGKLTVRCDNYEALRQLPMAIGSPAGHFGQFERAGSPVLPIHRPYFAVYCLNSTITANCAPATKQNLTEEVGTRLVRYLAEMPCEYEVCIDPLARQIVVGCNSQVGIGMLPTTFNGVFFN